MGLLQILRRQPKNKFDLVEKELDELDVAIKLLTKQVDQLDDLVTREEKLLGLGKPTTKAKAKPTLKPVATKKKFRNKTAIKELTDWFNRRSNKYLTKEQIQTMSTSPLKGIPNSTFYEVVKSFERDRSERPIKYRLR